jgi:Fur family transcriptional regulator, ferric uptake regulator
MARNTKSMTSNVEALHTRLNKYMARRGLRSTAQRRLVTDVFFRSRGHLSIEELLAQVRAQDSKVGYATVYRTLKMLAESGLANERHFGDGVSRYEIAHHGSHHDHLICVKCGRIEEFEDERIEKLQEGVAKRHGFALTSHKHELYGVCGDCRTATSTTRAQS